MANDNDRWWSSLSPDEQDSLMLQAAGGITGPTNADFVDEEDPFQLNGGFDFSYSGGNGAGVQPNVGGFTTKGKVNLGDLAQEAKRVNLLQDYGSLSVDNILSGYTGGGGYDAGAFTPTYEYGQPINLPGRRKAEVLSKSGGWQGFVTDLIFGEGLSPAEAEAKLYETINAPDDPSLSDQDRQLRDTLKASMEPLRMESPVPGATDINQRGKKIGEDFYDTENVNAFTTRVWSDLLEDPDFSYQDPKTGLYYAKTPEEAMVKTPQMLAYDKFGIPYPTATYEDPKYQDAFVQAQTGMTPEELGVAGERFQSGQNRLDKETARAQARAETSGQATTDLERMYREFEANPPTIADRRTGPVENPYNLDQPSLEAANKAGEIDLDLLLKDPNLAGQFGMPSPTSGQQSGDYDRQRKAWIDQQKQRLLEEAYQRGAKQDIPNALYSAVNTKGNRAVVPRVKNERELNTYNFGNKVLNALGGITMGATNRQPGGKTTLGDVTRQRVKSGRDINAARRSERLAGENTFNDPRLAQIEALARAVTLTAAGQTPFRDAMAARNANARRMLGG